MNTHNALLLPEPPYYAVIFSSQRTLDDNGYHLMAAKMAELASKQSGFLGGESIRGSDGFGITISYWSSLTAIKEWKANNEHLAAQKMGQQSWYQHYRVKIAKVEHAYEG